MIAYVLNDNSFTACLVDPIIQSRRAARSRQGRKPCSERGLRGEDLSHKDVRALRAAPEATLPRQLGGFAHTVLIERIAKRVVEDRGTATVAALRAATDHDSEPTRRHVYRA